MIGTYREIFSARGSAAFSAAGFVARLPIAMVGIGIVTMLSQLRGDYGLAGALSAVFALAYAAITPLVSRAVDRYGQRRVLPAASAISACALGVMLLCVRFEAPDFVLFLLAIPAGCMPTIGAMVRARWTALYRGQPQLRTAFAFESVLDEVCFVAGPVISVGLSVALFPEAGPLLALILLVIGTFALVAQRGTEPAVRDRSEHVDGSVVRNPAMWALVAVMLGMGTIFGTVDVVSIAFATERGTPAAATVALALFAGASAVAGVVFGALRPGAALRRQLVFATAAVAVLLWPLLLVDSILTLTGALALAGISVAPTMIVATTLVESVVPHDKLTEGITWTVTGLGVGVAVGSALAGQMIDHFGTRAGFAVAVASGAVAFVVALGAYLLRRAK
ncbi:MFS transporter [Rhodococcus sp. AG1013]|uniref:MFS transporter n=1 Tax=unclassified Rhodococcus (in: high G+C Gram-positive bacteria) TaxID=192944 RepID=UPI000E0BE9E8|nr:MFS transporter [Rhodococcus sp. AG1013]RDI33761.1 putative MFS family arabinose efflux permease [Rhodococcus sp. AG1013]